MASANIDEVIWTRVDAASGVEGLPRTWKAYGSGSSV